MIIAGYDVSYAKHRELAIAWLTLFAEDGSILEEHHCRYAPRFPYVPGELYRRERLGLDTLLPRLTAAIDCLVIDGCGTLHPQQNGAACRYAELYDLPRSVGCAKNLLVGDHGPLDEAQGSEAAVMLAGERIGTVYRSAAGVKPVYISAGGGLSQDAAVAIIAPFCRGFRIPEVIRRPDLASRQRLRELESRLDRGEGEEDQDHGDPHRDR